MAEPYLSEPYLSPRPASRPEDQDGYAAHRRKRTNSRSRQSAQGSTGWRHEEQPPLPSQNFPDTGGHEAALEGEEYLPPMTGPSSRRRQRHDSFESWGSSVMPALLPHKSSSAQEQRHSSHGRGASSQERAVKSPETEGAQGLLSPPGNAGIEGWLRSQAPAGTTLDDGHAHVRSHASQSFASFAPAGRLRKMGSDAGSVGGDGSIGGWSQGKMSSSGARKYRLDKKSSMPRSIKGDQRATPLWEGDENDGQAAPVNSLEQWRASSAVPPDPNDLATKEPTIRRRKYSNADRSEASGRIRLGTGSVTAPSVAGSAFPNSVSQQSLRRNVTGLISGSSNGEASKRADATPLRTAVRGLTKEGVPANTVVLAAAGLALFMSWTLAGLGDSGQLKHGWQELRYWSAATANLPPADWYSHDLGKYNLDKPPLMGWLSWAIGRIGSSLPQTASAFTWPVKNLNHAQSTAAVRHLSALGLGAEFILYFLPAFFFLRRRLSDRGRRTKVVAICTYIFQPALALAAYGLGGLPQISLGLATLALAFFYTSLPNPDSDVNGSNGDRLQRTTNLSRRVSYNYVAATTVYLWAICVDQASLCFAPAFAALVAGRWLGLTQVGFARSAVLTSGLGIVLALTILAVFWPWMSLTTLDGLRPMLARILHHNGSQTPPQERTIPRNSLTFLLTNSAALTSQQQSIALLTLGILAAVYPILMLVRAAAETVRIEMFLDEVSLRSAARAQDTSLGPRHEGLGLPGEVTPTSTAKQSQSVQRKAATSHRASSVAPSEPGSDLRSLAESMMRGGSEQPTDHPVKDAKHSTIGRRSDEARPVSSSCPSPSAALLPYATLAITSAFALSGASDLVGPTQELETSTVLLTFVPLMLLAVMKGDDWGGGSNRTDWQWAVLGSNACVFAIWPRLRQERLSLPTIAGVALWNWLIGNRPWIDVKNVSAGLAALTSNVLQLYMAACILLSTTGSLVDDGWTMALDTVVTEHAWNTVLGLTYVWAIVRTFEVGIGNGLNVGLFGSKGSAKSANRSTTGAGAHAKRAK